MRVLGPGSLAKCIFQTQILGSPRASLQDCSPSERSHLYEYVGHWNISFHSCHCWLTSNSSPIVAVPYFERLQHLSCLSRLMALGKEWPTLTAIAQMQWATLTNVRCESFFLTAGNPRGPMRDESVGKINASLCAGSFIIRMRQVRCRCKKGKKSKQIAPWVFHKAFAIPPQCLVISRVWPKHLEQSETVGGRSIKNV